MKHALEGIRVVDVSQFAAGPMAARLLGDLAADVLHIENPARGDVQRKTQLSNYVGVRRHMPHKINYVWENLDRNKKSVTIDLSREHGREILYKLVEGQMFFRQT